MRTTTFLRVKMEVSMRKHAIAAITAGITFMSIAAPCSTALKGTALFGANGIYSVKLENWTSLAAPRLISNTGGLSWPRFSPNGKIIAALNASTGKVYALFNDGSGMTEVASDAAKLGAGDEVEVVEWVKTIDGSYEIAYPQNQSPVRAMKSVVIEADFAVKRITKKIDRIVAQNIGATGAASWLGIAGAFDLVDMADGTRRILTRSRAMAEMHSLPDKNTIAQSGSAFCWPDRNWPGNFYTQPDDGHMWPHSCFHGISRDGAWVQLNQNIHVDDEWPGEKGDHLGFILCPWQMPATITQTNYCTTLAYILYSTPSTFGTTKVRNYHWTNDRKVIVAAAQSGGSYYVIQLASYPPVAVSGKNGSAAWTSFPLPGSSEPWGCDLWVGDLPPLTATGAKAVHEQTAKGPGFSVAGRVFLLPTGAHARIVNARGVTVARIAQDASGRGSTDITTPGIYCIVAGRDRQMVMVTR